MTMLDRMRRHKGWLKWSLALVVVAFIILYIPDFLQKQDPAQTGALPHDQVAQVNGRGISVLDFRTAYQRQLSAYRQAYGSSISEQMLKQLGFEQQVLQQLVNEQAMLAEAARLGMSVADAEVRQRILAMPQLQLNGQFVGEAQYQAILARSSPPTTPAEFEARLRRDLLVEKLQALVTDWVAVTDAEADAEFTRRNEKVKVQLVHVAAAAYLGQASATDAEVAAYYEAHKQDYEVGERRKVRYVLVDTEALRTGIVVPSRELERYYNDNLDLFSTPEQVRASHILFKIDGKTEADVRASAEKVLAEARAGKDFAALAKQYSEDEATAALGGDLDYFGRGRMTPAFEEAAFGAEQPGLLPDLVRSPFGFHIIKVVDKKAGTTRSFDEVRPQILDQLTGERAQRQAERKAEDLAKAIVQPGDMDKAAAGRGLKVEETGFFTANEPILAFGASQQVSNSLFALADGAVSTALPVGRGFIVAVVSGKLAASIPPLDEVKDRVRNDVLRQKAGALAADKMRSAEAAIKAAADFAAAAKKAGFEAKTSELVARGAALPDVGVNAAVERAAFSLPAGATSDTIAGPDGATIVKVLERKEVAPAEVAASRESVRQELIDARRSEFFSAYMTKARQRMKIEYNRRVIDQIIG
ncbi:MAG TPA: peptidyl-prolyl cis-trans isomerase [Vicinamibacterales bacterium]|nr:peptidyl-prolyl cis-trans isomerase [Vicinamibacterales bacterium]